MVPLQVAVELAERSAKQRQAALHQRVSMMHLAFQAWYDWLGARLVKMTAQHERLIYLQVCLTDLVLLVTQFGFQPHLALQGSHLCDN